MKALFISVERLREYIKHKVIYICQNIVKFIINIVVHFHEFLKIMISKCDGYIFFCFFKFVFIYQSF